MNPSMPTGTSFVGQFGSQPLHARDSEKRPQHSERRGGRVLTITQVEDAEFLLARCRSAVERILSTLSELSTLAGSLVQANNTRRSALDEAQKRIDDGLKYIADVVQETGDDRPVKTLPERFLDGSLALQHTAMANKSVAFCQLSRADFSPDESLPISVFVQSPALPAEVLIPRHVLADQLHSPMDLRIRGTQGCEDFHFKAGTTLRQLAATLNLFADATGVSAKLQSLRTACQEPMLLKTNEGNELCLQSLQPGSQSVVAIRIENHHLDELRESVHFEQTSYGQDMVATINGIPANSVGNLLQAPAVNLDLALGLTPACANLRFSFSIVAGGIQLNTPGLNARIGIDSLAPNQFGGSAARLYEIGSGQAHSLHANAAVTLSTLRHAETQATRLYDRLLGYEQQLRQQSLTNESQLSKAHKLPGPHLGSRTPSRPPARLAAQNSAGSSQFARPIIATPSHSLFTFDPTEAELF
ncbi:MAG: hypothetical protein NXI32_25115 [bacterium]|nr:hypothetical protein [bacterium]